MNMKNVNPISADVLVALHAIQLHLAGVVSAETVTAILWGYASCDGDVYVLKKEVLPIESVIVLLNEHGCEVDCEMRLADKEIEEYGPALGKLIENEKKSSKIVSNLLRGMKVKVALKECATVALCILTERRKIIKKHDAPLIASMMHRPVVLRWETNTSMCAVIGQIEREYLSAFKTPGKIKWEDNVESWEVLKSHVLEFLNEHYKDYVSFWISQGVGLPYGGFSKLDETLLALESENLITIEDLRASGSQTEWKIRTNPKVISHQGKLPVYQGLITDSESIWRQTDPKTKQRFNEGYTYYLWTYLLQHVGKLLSRKEVEQHLDNCLPDKGKPHSLDAIIESLILKLASVSGINRKEIGTWFQKDKEFISLKTEKN